jgi:hypothetical protein
MTMFLSNIFEKDSSSAIQEQNNGASDITSHLPPLDFPPALSSFSQLRNAPFTLWKHTGSRRFDATPKRTHH